MKSFLYEKNTLIEIMNVNLTSIYHNSFDDIIKVCEEQYREYIDLLIIEEKYEYCQLLENNKDKILIKEIFKSKNNNKYEN